MVAIALAVSLLRVLDRVLPTTTPATTFYQGFGIIGSGSRSSSVRSVGWLLYVTPWLAASQSGACTGRASAGRILYVFLAICMDCHAG